MSKTYYELENGHMIMSFADLEGDLEFLKRSLALYKEKYKQIFHNSPAHQLIEGDFTIVKEGTREAYIQYPKTVSFVNLGDLTDKTNGHFHNNIALITILNNTHAQNKGRMFSILGNRDLNKLRFQTELDENAMTAVLEQELALAPDMQNAQGPNRPRDMVWVDVGRNPQRPELEPVNFLTYLKRELAAQADPVDFFKQLSLENKQVHYVKWMLQNSCGAPQLWSLLEAEKALHRDNEAKGADDNDLDTLEFFKEQFVNEGSPHAQYLNNSQFGVQIGNTLFTHSGINDNSFVLTKELIDALTERQLQEAFLYQVPAKEHNGEIIAQNVSELLYFLNYCMNLVNTYRFIKDSPIQQSIQQITTQLVIMGLPTSYHHGKSVVNLPVVIEEEGHTYGFKLTTKNFDKVVHSGNAQRIDFIQHGHMPSNRERIAKIENPVDGEQSILVVGIDTCYNRQELTAIAPIVFAHNNIISFELNRIDKEGVQHFQQLPSRTYLGFEVDIHGQDLLKDAPSTLIGKRVQIEKLSQEDKQNLYWTIASYDAALRTFSIHRQGIPELGEGNGVFENYTVTAAEIYAALGLDHEMKHEPAPGADQPEVGPAPLDSPRRDIPRLFDEENGNRAEPEPGPAPLVSPRRDIPRLFDEENGNRAEPEPELAPLVSPRRDVPAFDAEDEEKGNVNRLAQARIREAQIQDSLTLSNQAREGLARELEAMNTHLADLEQQAIDTDTNANAEPDAAQAAFIRRQAEGIRAEALHFKAQQLDVKQAALVEVEKQSAEIEANLEQARLSITLEERLEWMAELINRIGHGDNPLNPCVESIAKLNTQIILLAQAPAPSAVQLTNLNKVLEAVQKLLDEGDHNTYQNLMKEMHQAPSEGYRILAGLMMAVGVALVATGFVMSLAPVAAVGAVSVCLGLGSLGIFKVKNRPEPLVRDMIELDESYHELIVPVA